ncbi:MAG: hypothetical protein J7496_13715 [Novosphingobium sp.]|nr:hypothetical protein [Novosphingobium sp.]MBO9603554.1 hypothetical protein [Novosphingobium sp.]
MTRFVRLAAIALAATAVYATPSYAASDVAGTWTIAADAQGQQFKSTLTVAEGDGGAFTVDVQPLGESPMGPMKSTISEVKVDGEMLSFKQHLDSDQFKIDLTYTLTVSGNSLSGEANSDFGPTPITGTRAG